MNKYVEIMVIAEGVTDYNFLFEILVPYLAHKNIFMRPVIASKKGQKGGDIKFDRIKNDFGLYLKQRKDTYLTMFIDFYGIKAWPDYDDTRKKSPHTTKAKTFLSITKAEVVKLFAKQDAERRFIPYVNMHEFEALLFSEPDVLSQNLHIDKREIDSILIECGEPENINDSQETAPSKRLKKLQPHYEKISTGITIAKAIGIDAMRQQCPLFNAWLTRLEALASHPAGQ